MVMRSRTTWTRLLIVGSRTTQGLCSFSKEGIPMSSFPRSLFRISLGIAVLVMAQVWAFAQTPVPPVPNPCPRLTAGSTVHQPPALFSQNGVLNVRFSYQQTTDAQGRLLHCFMTPNGI